MSVQGLPASAVEFWQRHRDIPWPMCGAGPCQLPAIWSATPIHINLPRCELHKTGRHTHPIHEGEPPAGSLTTTFRRRR
jgi:hypothetical protein